MLQVLPPRHHLQEPLPAPYLPEHLQTLLSLAEESGADAAADGALTVDPDGRELSVVRPEPGVFGRGEILPQLLRRSGGLYACWNKLFSRALIGDIRFSAHVRAEDALFCVHVLSRAERCAVSDAVGYRYLRRADSVTLRSPVRGLADQLRAWSEIYGLLEREAPELCPFAAEKICHDADTICRALLTSSREDRALVRSLREKYYPLQFGPGEMPAKKRAAAALYRLSPELYYRIAGR